MYIKTNVVTDFLRLSLKQSIREKSFTIYGLKISQSLKKQAHFEMTNFGLLYLNYLLSK